MKQEIIGFSKDGITYMKKNMPPYKGYISTTKHPKTINGKVVCCEKRFICIDTTEGQMLKCGYEPIYKKEVAA